MKRTKATIGFGRFTMAENRDYIIKNKEDGSVSISGEVIAIIAWEAMREVEGFGGSASGLTGDIADLIGRKNASRGVHVSVDETGTTIDVYITVRSGYSVTKVSRAVQESVYHAVQDMTGIHVNAVNVNVTGVAFDKTKQA